MLARIRETVGWTLVKWVIFLFIIAAFVINFGPQANEDLGCGESVPTYAVRVGDSDVSMQTWRMAINGLPQLKNRPSELIDLLVRRRLLADHGESLGLRVDRETVQKRTMEGHATLLELVPLRSSYCENDICDFDRLSQLVENGLRMGTVATFVDEQEVEHLATLANKTLATSVGASKEEALAQFEYQKNTATIRFLRFDPLQYRKSPTEADPELEAQVDTLLEQDAPAVKREYDIRFESDYKNAPKQLKLKAIFRQVDTADDENSQQVQQQLEDLRGQVATGSLAFEAALQNSDHSSKNNGGRIGWRQANGTNMPREFGFLGQPKDLESVTKDTLSPVLKTSLGYVLFFVEDLREGELSLEQVQRDIAKDLVVKTASKQAALSAATKALAKIQEEEKPLSDSYEQGFLNPQIEKLRKDNPKVYQQFASLQKQDPEKIQFYSAGPFPKTRSEVPSIGDSPELVRAVFGTATGDALLPSIWTIGDTYYIVEIAERTLPNIDDFEPNIAVQSLSAQRGQSAAAAWIRQKCQSLAAANKIKVHPLLLQQSTTSSVQDQTLAQYAACASL